MTSPGPDRARIYVFTGTRDVINQYFRTRMAHSLPADIYVNDTKIGNVSSGEALVFDVRPGDYSFTWMIYNQKKGFLEEMEPAQVTAEAGKIVLLSAELNGYTFAFDRGVLTSLVNPGGKSLKDGVRVTRPATCPPSICL